MLILSSFGVDAAKDFKENMLKVILNRDSPAPKRVIEGVVQPVAPTTAEQRLARKNELKAREKRFGGNKETKMVQKTLLKQQYENFTDLSQSSSFARTSTQNISFVSSQTTDSTNDPISTVSSVSGANAKIPVYALSNVDTLSNAMIGRNLGANGPTSMGFDMSKVECYNCHMKGHFARECRSSKDTRRNDAVEPQRRNVPVETTTSNALVSQCDEQERDDLKLKLEKFQTSSKNLSQLLSSQTNDKTKLGYNTQVFTSSMFDCDEMFTSETDESLPASPIYDRYHLGDTYHTVPPPYIGTFMPPKLDLVFYDAPNVNKTDHAAFNVMLSPTKPDNDLSHTHRPSAPIIEDWVSDSKEDFEAEIPHNVPSFVQPTEQVKSSRSFVKPDETSILAANHMTTISKPKINGNNRNRKACFVYKSLTYLIKDLLTKSKLVPIIAARPVTATVPIPHVTRPRQAKTIVSKPRSPSRRNINRSPTPKASNFPLKVTATTVPMVNVVKGNWANPQHALKDKGVIDSGCSRHITGNMSYLSNFKELDGGYVAFGGNPTGGKISGKGKIRTGKFDFDDVYFVKELKFNLFSVSQMCNNKNNVLFTDTECLVLSPEFKLPDENQVLLRVPRENNMYNVDLKNIVPSGDLTCLFEKATLNESNLWHRRLGHINFKTINKLVKGFLPLNSGFLPPKAASSSVF
nr:ribonuclease H-like domain-containing protein [Tanacetum cinerariifolium]